MATAEAALLPVVVFSCGCATADAGAANANGNASASSCPQLTCCVRPCHAPPTTGQPTSYELLVVDACGMRGWSTQFSVAAVNAALADEELSAAELEQVLATLLPCQQALIVQLKPDGSGDLRLEAWCHRTQRVPLLPPTQQQRQPDSDYRQAAFCISLPVSQDLDRPGWMRQQRGEAFAEINTGVLDALMQRDQQQQDLLFMLRSQMQLLHSYATQLQYVAERAVRTAVAGTSGLKDLPKQQQQQQQRSLQHNQHDSANARAKATAAASRGVLCGSQQPDAPPNGLALAAGFGTQAPAVGGALWSSSQQQPQPVRPGGGGGGGSGGASRAGGAASGGGRAHIARQSQDELALRQLWAEQQGLAGEWEQHMLPLLSHQGPLDSYLQRTREAGRVVDGSAAGGRRVVAQPWHLGQLPAQEELQQQRLDVQQPPQGADGKQQQQPGSSDQAAGAVLQQPGVPGVPGAAASLPAAGEAAANGPSSQAAAAPDALFALVAPAKQKQAAGQKRKAREGAGLLTRGRR